MILPAVVHNIQSEWFSDTDSPVISSMDQGVQRSASTNEERQECKRRRTSAPDLPTLEQQYILGCELGRGAQGVVRQCTHRASGLTFACKTIHKSSLATAADEKNVRVEIDIMQLLKGHPFIVSLEDVFEDDHAFHLVMELCEAGDLFDRIVAKRKLPLEEAAQILCAVAQALMFCHSRGVMHRDVKAENIFLTASGGAKLGDFGFAARLTPGQRLHEIAGTPDYLAPEVLSQDYDDRADLWSLGVLLYTMLTGERPYSAFPHCPDRLRIVLNANLPRQLLRKRRDLSASAADLITRLLCIRPDARLTLNDLLAHPCLASTCSSSISSSHSRPCHLQSPLVPAAVAR